jgi:twitching motility protein PilU
MDRDSALAYVHKLLAAMLEKKGSDLYITADAAPSIKLNNQVVPLTSQTLNDSNTALLVRAIMNDRQLRQFEETMEGNFSLSLPGKARFRVSAFTQRGCVGMVIRHIPHHIPNLEELSLPPVLKDLAMTKRGLLLVVGATSSGKSTTLASLVDYRNRTASGHIITIEDPIEFVHEHKKCLITQREIGVDTADFHTALKNTLRQAPDVILLGEIRDRETMDYAIAYAETGHLCLSTLHANSSTQAIDRIINFFPEERREQLLMDLSFNLKAVVSQRLVQKAKGEGRLPAVEVMINSPLIAEHIQKGEVTALKEVTSKSRELGMQTFDQALFDLIENKQITVNEGFRHADSVNELRLNLKLKSRFAKDNDFFRGTDELAIEPI